MQRAQQERREPPLPHGRQTPARGKSDQPAECLLGAFLGFFLGFSRVLFESRGSVPEAFGPGEGPSGSSIPSRWERVASRLARVLSSPSESNRAMNCRAGRADGARAAGGGEESKGKFDNRGTDQFHKTQIPAGAKPDLMCGDVIRASRQAAQFCPRYLLQLCMLMAFRRAGVRQE